MFLGSIAFPPLLWTFQVVSAPICWAILVAAIGLHYPIRCAVLTPSITGIGIALPMCLMDEIIGITDKFITSCPANLFIPAAMISGPICPANGAEYIDFINCSIVGISDGVQHILFLGYILLGQMFADWVVLVSSTVVAHWFPGVSDYFRLTMASFQFTSDTQRERQWICFGLTAVAMAGPLFVTLVAVGAIGIAMAFVVMTLLKTWNLIEASPLAMLGQDDEDDDTWEEPPNADPMISKDDDEDVDLDAVNAYVESSKVWLDK